MEGNIISSLLGPLERANQGAHTLVKWDASTNMGPQNNVVHENMLLPRRFVYSNFRLALDVVGQVTCGVFPFSLLWDV